MSSAKLAIPSDTPFDSNSRILVTGANGFIGSKVVEALLEHGYRHVRCLVRPSSDLTRLDQTLERHGRPATTQIVVGDLTSRDDCTRVCEGVVLIYHLAAGFEKSFAAAFINSVIGTRNLIEAFLANGVVIRRFVNVSSFAVYSTLHLKRHAPLDEDCLLEEHSQERYDAYGFGKIRQERLVREYGRQGLPFVVLRPGIVFGEGKRDLSGRIGIDTFGVFVRISGGNTLPLTYVNNCADAVVLAGLVPGVDGSTFNVVDDELLTTRQFVRAFRRRNPSFRYVPLPYVAARVLSALWERYAKWSQFQLPPAFNRHRCSAEWKGNVYSNRRLREALGWAPRVRMDAAMDAFLSQFEGSGR
jgi:nucleoside-diphosphate-sugar epimerase